jgi:hypothetical protein
MAKKKQKEKEIYSEVKRFNELSAEEIDEVAAKLREMSPKYEELIRPGIIETQKWLEFEQKVEEIATRSEHVLNVMPQRTQAPEVGQEGRTAQISAEASSDQRIAERLERVSVHKSTINTEAGPRINQYSISRSATEEETTPKLTHTTPPPSPIIINITNQTSKSKQNQKRRKKAKQIRAKRFTNSTENSSEESEEEERRGKFSHSTDNSSEESEEDEQLQRNIRLKQKKMEYSPTQTTEQVNKPENPKKEKHLKGSTIHAALHSSMGVSKEISWKK